MPEGITEAMVDAAIAAWPGRIDRKTARKRLRYAAEHGCPVRDECLGCPRLRDCPVLDGD